MNDILRFLSSNTQLARLFTILMIILGITALSNIQRDLFPQVEFDIVMIGANYPNASSTQVELDVTNKIEDSIKSITGIKEFTSSSKDNSALVVVRLEQNLNDTDKVKQKIKDAVNSLNDLPTTLDDRPWVIEVDTNLRAFLEINLSSDVPYEELRTISKQLADNIGDLPGVALVQKYGYYPREIEIHLNTQKLNEYRLSLTDIITAIQNNNRRATAGEVIKDFTAKNVITLSEFQTPEKLKEVVVSADFLGPIIHLSDVASITITSKKTDTINRTNGFPSISLEIIKEEDADIIKTTKRIKDYMALFSVANSEVSVSFSNEDAFYIDNRLNVLVNNGLIGLIAVLIILTIFLTTRLAFWVSLSIPVSLLGSIFLLWIFGETLNVVVLAGIILVLGIVVDDSIIVAENIYRYKEKGKNQLNAIVKGLSEVYAPIFITILTTIAAFAPMLFMTGIVGKFIFVIPLVVIFALMLSFLEITFALPAHLLHSKPSRRKVWFKVAERNFYGLIHLLLNRRYYVLFVFILILGLAIFIVLTKSHINVFPNDGADRFNVKIELPISTSLEDNLAVVKKVEMLIKTLPENELVTYVSRLGDGGNVVDNTDINGKHLSLITVYLTPINKRAREVYEIVEELQEKTKIKNASVIYSTEGGGPPVGAAVEITLMSNNDKERLVATNQLEAWLKKNPNVYNVKRNDSSAKEQIEVRLDYEKMAALGVDIRHVENYLQAGIDGIVATTVRYGDEDVDFRVKLDTDNQDILALKINNHNNRFIELRQFATLVDRQAEPIRYHTDGQRSIRVEAYINEQKTTAQKITYDAINALNAENYPTLRIITGGISRDTEESLESLGRAFFIAIVAIYLLLMLLFNSLTQPFLVMTAIPFGLSGIIFSFYFHQVALSFMAMLGAVGMIGVVVNDSLILVNRINQKIKKYTIKKHVHIINLVAFATKERLRAIVLTTLTTFVSVIPLAYGIGGSDPFLEPMALALGYGLLFAMPLTLILLPCLYIISFDMKKILAKITRFLLKPIKKYHGEL